jgi:hypothetical protein
MEEGWAGEATHQWTTAQNDHRSFAWEQGQRTPPTPANQRQDQPQLAPTGSGGIPTPLAGDGCSTPMRMVYEINDLSKYIVKPRQPHDHVAKQRWSDDDGCPAHSYTGLLSRVSIDVSLVRSLHHSNPLPQPSAAGEGAGTQAACHVSHGYVSTTADSDALAIASLRRDSGGNTSVSDGTNTGFGPVVSVPAPAWTSLPALGTHHWRTVPHSPSPPCSPVGWSSGHVPKKVAGNAVSDNDGAGPSSSPSPTPSPSTISPSSPSPCAHRGAAETERRPSAALPSMRNDPGNWEEWVRIPPL